MLASGSLHSLEKPSRKFKRTVQLLGPQVSAGRVSGDESRRLYWLPEEKAKQGALSPSGSSGFS